MHRSRPGFFGALQTKGVPPTNALDVYVWELDAEDVAVVVREDVLVKEQVADDVAVPAAQSDIAALVAINQFSSVVLT